MLVCGQPPFQEANDSETLTMILDCRYAIPSHVSSQCADLISQMLQRNPLQRASLEQIENHPWLQGVDPSPASRYLLPLTSHKRVSEEEHEIIIQAMMCGNIADRETIQEALEANHYNHVTATYFLLAERILREKQEKQSPNPSLVYNLAQHVQSRSTFSTVSDPNRPASSADKSPQPLLTTKSALENFAEHSGKSILSFSALGESESPSSFHVCGQPIRALIRPSLIETPIAKSTPALQQISEEEEEEEEEEEGRPGLFRRRTSSLNQEQMSDFQSAKASLLFCRSLAAHSKIAKAPAAGFTKACSLDQSYESSLNQVVLQRPLSLIDNQGLCQEFLNQAVQLERTSNFKLQGEKTAPESPPEGTTEGKLWLGSKDDPKEGDCGQVAKNPDMERHIGKEEDNNNTPPVGYGPIKEKPLKKGGIHIPQKNEAQGTAAQANAASESEGKSQKPDGSLEMGPPGRPKHLSDSCGNGSPSGSESLADNIIKLDPAKGKSANLKDRILQFPLCEKALAFRMRPASKESLLSLGQFNCCHVI
uniref:Uncharacterized protein n=2 Tax=Sphaerodactylus townsendi TaxID=933632 RepID=A0ACB8EBI0_9SAUR